MGRSKKKPPRFSGLPERLRQRCIEVDIGDIRRRRVSAIYMLIERDEVVYVGQTGDIEVRLESHAKWPVVRGWDRVAWFPVKPELLDAVEGALIRALRPRENRAEPVGWRESDGGLEEGLLISMGFGEALS